MDTSDTLLHDLCADPELMNPGTVVTDPGADLKTTDVP